MHYHNPGFVALVNEARARVREITVDEYRSRLDRGEACVLVDIREDSEWAAGHLPNAVHLGKGVIERDVETKFPDKASPLVLQCGGGFRSILAADTLQRMGYSNVVSLGGGYREWETCGLPIEQDRKRP